MKLHFLSAFYHLLFIIYLETTGIISFLRSLDKTTRLKMINNSGQTTTLEHFIFKIEFLFQGGVKQIY